jgi:hypothetical protein
MNLDWLIALAPVAAKFVVDLVLKVLPKVPRWLVQVIAVVIGVVATWLAGLAAGTGLPAWQTGLIGASVIIVNEVAKTIRDWSTSTPTP